MAQVLFLIFSICTSYWDVDAKRNTLLDAQNHFILSNKITHQVDNDFDCVDIYNQPALQHPLLKNHKIQLYPTFAKEFVQSISSGNVIGECPNRKVPIYNLTRRHHNIINSSSKFQIDNLKQYSKSSPGYHTVTLDTTQNMTFHGGFAAIAVYDLSLQPTQYSLSSIWIESGPPMELNSISAGTGVYPNLYGDSRLRITGQWTADGYGKTGCFNYVCPGFVQVNQNKDNALGAVLSPPSSQIGQSEKYSFSVKIKQDQSTGHWWLIIDSDSRYVGYWPKELFPHLNNGASLIKFGGQTYAPPNNESPPMGSGRLPQEKFINSSFIGRLQIIDSEYNEVDIKKNEMKKNSDANSDCYDLMYNGYQGKDFRQALLYGGPGGPNCNI